MKTATRKNSKWRNRISFLLTLVMIVQLVVTVPIALADGARNISETLLNGTLVATGSEYANTLSDGKLLVQSVKHNGDALEADAVLGVGDILAIAVDFRLPSLADLAALALDNATAAYDALAADDEAADALLDRISELGLAVYDGTFDPADYADYLVGPAGTYTAVDADGNPFYIQAGDELEFSIPQIFWPDTDPTWAVEDNAGKPVGVFTFDKTSDPKNVIVTLTIANDASIASADGTLGIAARASLNVTVMPGDSFVDDPHSFTIFDQDYTFVIPGVEEKRNLEKTAQWGTNNKTINWTIMYTGETGTNTNAELPAEGHYIVDDLTDVGGEIVEESISILANGGALVKDDDYTLTVTENKLRIDFISENAVTPIKITFATVVDPTAAASHVEHDTTKGTIYVQYSNTAIVYDEEGTEVDKDSADVKRDITMIAKTGESNDDVAGFIDGKVDDGQYSVVTWKIVANHEGYTLNNAVITDIMDYTNIDDADRLTFIEARLDVKTGETNGVATWEPAPVGDDDVPLQWYSKFVTRTGENDVPNPNFAEIAKGKARPMPTEVVNETAKTETYKFELGTISDCVMLTIVAAVKINPIGKTDNIYYKNSAEISWTGGTVGSGQVKVGIGYNALSKTGRRLNQVDGITIHTAAGTQGVRWNVTAKARGAGIPDMAVYDLLVHGSTLPANFTAIATTSVFGATRYQLSGVTLELLEKTTGVPDLSAEKLTSMLTAFDTGAGGVSARVNQMYTKDSFASGKTEDGIDHLIHYVYKVMDGETWIADLVVMIPNTALPVAEKFVQGQTAASPFVGTENNDGVKGVAYGTFTATFDTTVVNSAVFAANTTHYNDAFLYSATSMLANDTHNVNFKASKPTKYAIARDNVAAYVESDFDLAKLYTKGELATHRTDSFDYDTKSALFALDINPLGLNLTDSLVLDTSATTNTKVLGPVTITDTLPAGWELRTGKLGTEFKLYDEDGKLVAATDYADILTYTYTAPIEASDTTAAQAGKIGFAFTELNAHYTIILEAGMTDTTAEEFFSENQTGKNYTNTLNQSGASGGIANAVVNVKNTLLNKKHDAIDSENGIIPWMVTYDPKNIDLQDVYEKYPGFDGTLTLTDTMSSVISPIFDDHGALDATAFGIKVYSTLKADGTYDDTAAKTYTPEEIQKAIDAGDISFELVTPDVSTGEESHYKLKFAINESASKYEISYKTKLVTEVKAGDRIKNTITIDGVEIGETTVGDEYMVKTNDFEAYMNSLTKFKVLKIDGLNGQELSGATFGLYRNVVGAAEPQLYRIGRTGSAGTIVFAALPNGTYKLIEMKAPNGYEQDFVAYTVTVLGDDIKVERTGFDSEDYDDGILTVKNYKSDSTGALQITKTVSGIAPRNYDYEFMIEFDYSAVEVDLVPAEDATFDMLIGTVVSKLPAYASQDTSNPDDIIDLPITITLNPSKAGTATIKGIPVGTVVTVTELTTGYTTTTRYMGLQDWTAWVRDMVSGEHVVEVSETIEIVFNNHRTGTVYPDPDPEPEPEPEPEDPTTGTELPDPNDPDSPDEFTLVDDEGAILGHYEKDENGEYVLDEEIPLGMFPPATGDSATIILWIVAMLISAAVCAVTMLPKKRKVK